MCVFFVCTLCLLFGLILGMLITAVISMERTLAEEEVYTDTEEEK